ncbi:MAG TPA: zinc ribbon domain-containing protein [Acidobacteriota bacterium]|jgi:putative FmdB family regulatory protein
MPIFEFRCNQCRKRFEQIVFLRAGMSSDALVCPHCGASDATKLPSRFAMAGVSKKSESDLDDFDSDLDQEMDDLGGGDLDDDYGSDDLGGGDDFDD